MKKLILLAILVTLFNVVNGQEVKFGLKSGVNLSTFTGKSADSLNSKSIIGFHIGAVAEISISEKFSFQPELLFSTQGFEFDKIDDLDGERINGKTQLNYLNFPLIGKFNATKGLSLEAGPQIGFLMSAKREGKITTPNGITTENNDNDIKDETKSVDFGLNFGAGYKLENGLFFNARYNLGLTKLDDANADSLDFKNGVFQISLGYFF